MPQNYATKYMPQVQERFKKASLTDAAAGKDYSFVGAQTIVIQSIDVVDLNNFNRTAANNRFGAVANLGNTKQEMTMTQDKSFAFAIDAGDQSDTAIDMNAGKALRREIDEVVVPTMDKYRLDKWATGAGTVLYSGSTAALNTDKILNAIIELNSAMSDALVPEESRTLFIPTSTYTLIKEKVITMGLEGVGTRTLSRGEVGTLDNCRVVKVPTSWFPTTKAAFMIKYKNCTVDPVKLQNYHIRRDAQGFDGPVVEGRVYYDAFVKNAVNAGVAVYKIGTAPTP